MSADQLMLIDISGLAHATFHVSGNEPDPSYISNTLISRVRAIASAHPHAAICCDSGRSFRKDLDPTYKAGRDTENRAVIGHQLAVALDVLRKDGFAVWAVPGMEADDIIASAVKQATAIPDTTVLVVSEDKDLLQLVSDRVTQRKFDGATRTPADVFDKFGVRPEQMGDLLALMGDKSDNIVGAVGIGKVHAPRLLSEHGTIEGIYKALDNGGAFTDVVRKSLTEFRERWPLVRSLVALKSDVEIPFAEIAAERVAAPMSEVTEDEVSWDAAPTPERELSAAESANAFGATAARIAAAGNKPMVTVTPTDIANRADERNAQSSQVVPYVAPATVVDFSQQLEPRSMPEAVQLAQRMFESRLFGAYGTPQAVLSVVLAGREMGMGAMASLRGFHIIENKPQMSADTMAALVLKSGKAKYFRCVERTDTRCTFVTQRLPVDDYPEQRLTVTIEEMRAAWKKDQKAWDNSGWGKVPASMLVAAGKRTLARLEYPDVVGNLYDSDEMS